MKKNKIKICIKNYYIIYKSLLPFGTPHLNELLPVSDNKTKPHLELVQTLIYDKLLLLVFVDLLLNTVTGSIAVTGV